MFILTAFALMMSLAAWLDRPERMTVTITLMDRPSLKLWLA